MLLQITLFHSLWLSNIPLCVCVCVCVCVCDDYVLIYWKFQVIDIVVHFGVSYLGLIKRKKLNEMKLNETHHF